MDSLASLVVHARNPGPREAKVMGYSVRSCANKGTGCGGTCCEFEDCRITQLVPGRPESWGAEVGCRGEVGQAGEEARIAWV